MDLNEHYKENIDMVLIDSLRRQLLAIFLEECLRLYQQSTSERGQLHQIEKEGLDDAPSILGEVEIRSDAIAGSASWIDKRGRVKNVARLIKTLKQYSIYDSPVLIRWLVEDGKNYPTFSAYVHLCEHVRMLLLEWLQGNGQE